MRPISAANNTRVRADHNTFATYWRNVNATDLLQGTELWTAPADGTEVKAGDTWLKVDTINGVPVTQVSWVAYVHKGTAICKDFKEIPDEGQEPTPIVSFPESCVWENTDPNHPDYGKRAEYIFVRVIE